MIRPIHPGLSPNIEREDFFEALSLLVSPWRWQDKRDLLKLEQWFTREYHAEAFAFASGRGALSAALLALDVKKDDEVLVTGFTCVAVVDAVLAIGAKPVYIDITKNFTLDVKDLKKKITKKAKVLILQHTFGIDNATKEVLELARKHHLQIVSDMAHGIGITHGSSLLGLEADICIFSFGRDKAFSSVSGGMVITQKEELAGKLATFLGVQQKMDMKNVFQNLFHIVSMYTCILPLYDFFSLGKGVLVLFQKIGLLAKPIDAKEVDHFSIYTAKLSPALARVSLLQLKRIERFNATRTKYSASYADILREYVLPLNYDMPLLRFPLLVEDPKELKKLARKQNVYLGDWYSNLIDPKGTNIERLFYKKEQCPTAVSLAEHIVNLPTYPTLTEKDFKKVVTIVLSYVTSRRNNK